MTGRLFRGDPTLVMGWGVASRNAAAVAVVPAGADRLSLALPAGAPGRWCRLVVTVQRPGEWWVKVEATDRIRGQVVREAFLGPKRSARRRGARAVGGSRALLLHVPQEADELVLRVIAVGGAGGTMPAVTLRVLGRSEATLRLLLGGWRKWPACLQGGMTGLVGRSRAELGQAPARSGEAPPYSAWVAMYDVWGDAERAALRSDGVQPPIEVVVVGGAPGDAALSLGSVARQWLQPIRVRCVASLGEAGRQEAAWLVVLRAGDVLADHALACFAYAIRSSPDAPGFYADLDCLVGAQRDAPMFKPRADAFLTRAGLLGQGACVVRPNGEVAAMPAGFEAIPFILTHVPTVRPALECAMPPSSAPLPRVSIIIPTSARAPHVLRCLRGVLAGTDYPDFHVLLAVSSVDPEDRVQARALTLASGLARVRVLGMDMAAFNYARVNNAAARIADGDLILLMNDDVMPIAADWLRRMVALTQAAAPLRADIVGARLLYGNNRVQHGGVIMGLAHLCEHAFRLSARDDAGPHGIAAADRQVSAVTAACLLVRRSVWDHAGGMDEGFAIALNDVDFCLRAGVAGATVVMAASVELYHYEGISLGRHYQGDRAPLEALEVQRLRRRWQSVIADDPFYNPQASLMPGWEFQPAFPPRLTPLCRIQGENAEQG